MFDLFIRKYILPKWIYQIINNDGKTEDIEKFSVKPDFFRIIKINVYLDKMKNKIW